MHFLFVKKEKSKPQKQIPKNKVSLEILHQRLGHRSKRSLLARDTENVWQYIDLKVDPDPLYALCHISAINKKSRSNTPLKYKTPFKWVFIKNNTSHLFQEFNKRHYLCYLPLNFG